MARYIALAALLSGMVGLPQMAAAHDSTLDQFGCHTDQTRGGYHCHKGTFNGLQFDSKSQFHQLMNIPTTDGKPNTAARPATLNNSAPQGNAANTPRPRTTRRGSTGPIQLSGKAKVLDGDTITIGSTQIQLYGIDAPETSQRCQAEGSRYSCGKESAKALRQMIGRKTVRCERKDDPNRRVVFAVCKAGKTRINAKMVQGGWALADQAKTQEYVNEELVAKIAKIGVWRGEFVPPWDWRKGKRGL